MRSLYALIPRGRGRQRQTCSTWTRTPCLGVYIMTYHPFLSSNSYLTSARIQSCVENMREDESVDFWTSSC